MENVSVFSEQFQKISVTAKSVQLEGADKEGESPTLTKERTINNDKSTSCSYCRVEFSDLQSQREHYKLDWHRYNLKQSLLSKQPINEDEFDEKNNNDDISSISGSDSDKEDTLDTYVTAQGKIFLQNEDKVVFSIYRCLVCDRKEEISDSVVAGRLSDCCVANRQWTVLMLGGGHFAGAVFRGHEPILHKTFHCYTVRAGQGGQQSSADNKYGAASSAGASLRRYNEQSLVQHVKSIVDIWRTEIDRSSIIIYRASGPYNRSVLFGGSSPLLERSNKKLRTIPFSSRRATFAELKRVHGLLSSSQVYESLEQATVTFSKQKSSDVAKRNKARASCINRAKSRETVERPLPTAALSSSSSSESSKEFELATDNVEISLEDLEPFGDSLSPAERKRAHKKKKKPRKSKTRKLREQDEAKKKELVEVVVRGDISKLKDLLDDYLKQPSEGESEEKRTKDMFFNQVVDDKSNRMLHMAALNEHVDMLKFLLDNEADPCLKNASLQTAYVCTKCKEIRESLKQFAKDNPDKYNYNKAQIPTLAKTDKETAEIKRAQRKAKREKEKEKKKQSEVRKKEEEERDRFLQLSDREKRALAAERRILSQSGQVIVRCFQCAADIAGKVPFEYLANVFCTMQCLKTHRMQHPQVLS